MKKIIIYFVLISVSVSLWAQKNYDWLIEKNWIFESGYNEPYNRLIFRKLEVPAGSILYQERLRKERFYTVYQTDDIKMLYSLKDEYTDKTYNIDFPNDGNNLYITHEGYFYSNRKRAGTQLDKNYPLVGVWGELPHLSEYRKVDHSKCEYYIEITEPYIGRGLPGNKIRMGTYLIKQTKKNVFETVSSFPDGLLRLEIQSDNRILLTPLFKLPSDESGRIGPMSIVLKE